MSLTDYLMVFALSLVPSVEGRYAIALAVAKGLNPLVSLLVSSTAMILLSALLPATLPLLDSLAFKLAEKGGTAGRLAGKYVVLLESARRRAAPYIEKWGVPGLALFVAMPLPGTGVWTGAAAAYVLGLARDKAFTALALGGLASNLVVFLSCEAGVRLLASWAP